MKTCSLIRIRAKSHVLVILFSLACYTITAQTFIYDFSGTPVLRSGTALAVGAVYLYSGVKTGTDAVVKITALTGGLTLGALDNTTQGYTQAFQPTLNVPTATATTTVNAYAEFSITFIVAGSYTGPTTYTIQAQSNVPATALDIDGTISGTDSLFEFDMLNLGTGSYVDYSTTGNQLKVTQSGTQFTGQTFTATNYPGINTTATAVMFTDINASLTTPLIFRTGIINQLTTSTASRVTSLAFFKPTYPQSILPVSPLTNFSGVAKDHAIDLQWQLAPYNHLYSLSLEREEGNTFFSDVQDYPLVTGYTGDTVSLFHFHDLPQTGEGDIFYRLKMVTDAGDLQYSNILYFKNDAPDKASSPFHIYPTVFHRTATVSVSTETAGQAILTLKDYSGRELYHLPLSLGKGDNIVALNLPGDLYTGNCIAILRLGHRNYTQKLIIAR